MDQIDAFPEHISTTVMPVTLPEKDRRLGICRSAGTRPGVHPLPGAQYQTSVCLVLQRQLASKKTLLDNFKRAILEAKHVNEFRPDDVLWEKISKGMLRNPDRLLKNTDKRMVYMYNNMFFVKKDFTFGFRTVKSGEIHLIQTTHVPMLIYELPSSSLRCRANPNLFRRSFEPFDQMLYHRMVLEPHTAYPIPAGTRYILLTVQKTMFGLQATPPTPAHVPAETHKRPLEQQPKPLSKKKRVMITPIIRPSVPSVRIIKPSTALSTPQPVSIPDPSPEQTTSQILLPDPPVVETTSQILLPDPPSNQTTSQIYLPDPNVVETLEPTLTDDSSIDQIMSSVFGDYLPQGIPSAHIQDPQVLDTVPSLFDENNDLISFLDYFEAGLAMEQQETPMDLTMPRMKKKVINTTGFKVIKPLDLSIRNVWRQEHVKKWFRYNTCWTSVDSAPRSSWETWVGGRIESRITSQIILIPSCLNPILGCIFLGRLENGDCVYESFGSDLGPRGRITILSSGSFSLSPSLGSVSTSHDGCVQCGFDRLPRVADVYVKWLTWLDDWEMHRDDPVPWRIVGLQPWKRALEQHVQRSHEKALAHGMPSDVTLLDHI
ncbi:hypothetical protein TNCV_3788221 [Trichonephila clavipes]|nr:hypothetical protein TNCV_3788221 [Trichonephila clavipes]